MSKSKSRLMSKLVSKTTSKVMSKIYRADFHVHTRFIEEEFNISDRKSRALGLIRSSSKSMIKAIFVKRAFYRKTRPKSDVAILDALKIPESTLEPDDAVKCALNNKMTFVPITNHNDVEAAIYLSKKFPGNVLIGQEISVMIDKNRMMHVLIFFLNYSKGELKYSSRDYDEIREIHSQIQDYRENLQALILFLKNREDIFISCSHPFSKTAFSRFIFTKKNGIDKDLIKIIADNFDAVEVFNGSYSEIENSLAREFAVKHGLGFSAGSDSHEMINDIDRGIISMPGSTYAEAEAKNLKDFLAKMKKRQVKIIGTKYPIEKIKWLLARKYFIHWSHIKNRIDKLIRPFSHIIFLYALLSHYAGYRNKLKHLAKKMGLSYVRFEKMEHETNIKKQ